MKSDFEKVIEIIALTTLTTMFLAIALQEHALAVVSAFVCAISLFIKVIIAL